MLSVLWNHLNLQQNPWNPQLSFIYRQENRDQTLLRRPFQWWWRCLGWRSSPPPPRKTLEEPVELAMRTLRGNISSPWLCLAPVLAAFSLLSLSSSYASVASGESFWVWGGSSSEHVWSQWPVLHCSSCFWRICGQCGGSGSTDFSTSSTNVSMRQSGVMAEGAAFRSFKDTVSCGSALNIRTKTYDYIQDNKLCFDARACLRFVSHLDFRIFSVSVLLKVLCIYDWKCINNPSPDLPDAAGTSFTYRKHNGQW